MKHLWRLSLLLLAPSTAAAQAGRAEPPRPDLARWLAPDTLGPRPIRLGLTRLPPLVPIDFRLPRVEDRLFVQLPFRDYVREWIGEAPAWPRLGRLDRDRRDEPAAAGRAHAFLPPVVQRDTSPDALLPGAIGRYADIGMVVTGYGELGGSWTRFEPCDPSIHLNCSPGLFPQLRPDVQFGVQVGGTISDRIHVNVDYDQTREETLNSNLINVFYQGFPDEVIQRIEVGDVQFRLPQSRYLTQGIPAGNFGLTASGQLGPIDFQTVWAQQRGDLSTREFRLAGGGTEGLVQEDQIVLDDADYVKGQFFFLVNPDSLAGTPHIDALFLRAADAPRTLRPEQGGVIQLYRDERIPPASGQQQVDLFLANAESEDRSLRHAGQFRRLDPEQDYLVHQSGLWVMLRRPLRPEEALAVAYITESRDTVGRLNAEQSPPGATPTLRLLRSPVANHQPGRPTWRFEMHQVYRVNSSSGVDLNSLDLRISLGDVVGGRTFREAGGRQVTFLRLFGLDEDAPADRIDAAQVFQPDALGAGQTGARITGTYIIFPTLQPFLAPPPVPSANLTAAAAAALLGNDANVTIYENTDPVTRDGGGRFRLNLTYRLQVDGLVQSFNLGQFGIREGSERITIGSRSLERGVDYTIDYEIGQVTLSDPGGLFGANPNAEIRASWEQRSLFQIAPTSIFGANATYRLGDRGALNFVGLYQSEKTLYARPQLGTEPASIFLGGVSADLDLGGGWLDLAFERMGLRSAGGARVTLTGEFATSMPDPNRRGQAYFDDFEGSDETSLDVRRQQWRLGSRPDETTGDESVLPASLDATNAATLVWQHDIATEGAVTGSLVPQRDIDRRINIIGNQLPEPVMWLTFGDGNRPPGQRVWRSMTTVLSTTGRDMTRDEFFELYVSAGGAEPLALILDFGTVTEDAFHVDSAGRTTGVYPDGRRWGLGLLDEEARVADREVWGATADARGLWDQACQAQPLQAYALGDVRSNCTRGNGVPDTEDLDGNGVLEEADGAYFRYVIRLDQPSPYLVRDTSQTGTGFRLYRIPLRSGTPVNGASDGTWRFIKHLRMTVAGEPGGIRKNLSIARPRIVGSRWTKRDVVGIVGGLIGEDPGIGAATTVLRVGPVSRVTDGADYAPPPGVRDQLQDPSAQFGAAGIEVNEKALRLAYDALEADDRAEVYFRYPQQPRSFMTYRRIRLWALAKRGLWGADGPERLVIKVGSDPRNYYLFRTPLPRAVGTGAAREADWLPEIVIDFDRWFALRVEAEQRLARGQATGRDTVWSADSTYALVLEDRARAPNLAAVREVSIAVHNASSAAIDGEVWINDIRLDLAVQDPGAATSLSFNVASDVLSATIGYASQSAVFRQLNQDASYVAAGDLSLSTRAQLDRALPASWGLDVPVSLTHTRSARDPSFLERSDVEAASLAGLRDSQAGATSVGIRVSKRTPSANPWLGLVLDGTTLTLGYDAAHTNTITSSNESGTFRGGIDYRRDIGRRDIDILPGFMEDALRALAPAAVERSDFFQRLASGRLRWTPQRIGFGANYTDANAQAFRYESILASDSADAAIRAIESPRRALDNTADILFAPFDALTAGLAVRSSRDLLDPAIASPLPLAQQALREARTALAGTDIGWETNRSLTSTVGFRPIIANWLRPSWTYTNRYRTDRNPSYLEVDVVDDDSVGVLQRRFGSDRQINRRLDLQPAALVRSLRADSVTGASRVLLRAIGAIQTLSVTWNSFLNSQFDRETFAPARAYQLGLGGLDAFRAIGADTAVSAGERSDLRTTSVIALPLGLQASLNYARSANDGFDVRGGQRRQRNRTWPGLNLNWRSIPMPGAISSILLAASAGAGYEQVERTSIYGIGNAQARGSTERRYRPEVRVTVAGGITASYNGTITRGTTLDPTGNGEQDGSNHTIQLTGILQPPGFLSDKIRNPIQGQFSFVQDEQQRCRLRPGAGEAEECVSFLDTTNRSVNFTLDTILSDITVGLRLSYTSRQNHVGTQTGSNQFQFALFGQFNFRSGEMGR